MEQIRKQAKRDKMKSLQRVRRHRAKILKQTQQKEYGSIVLTWADWKTVWVRRVSLWGKAYFAAKAAGEDRTIEFEVQWTPFLKGIAPITNYRFELYGVQYEIKHVDYLKDDGEWVKFRCQECPDRVATKPPEPPEENGNGGDDNDEDCCLGNTS